MLLHFFLIDCYTQIKIKTQAARSKTVLRENLSMVSRFPFCRLLRFTSSINVTLKNDSFNLTALGICGLFIPSSLTPLIINDRRSRITILLRALSTINQLLCYNGVVLRSFSALCSYLFMRKICLKTNVLICINFKKYIAVLLSWKFPARVLSRYVIIAQ